MSNCKGCGSKLTCDETALYRRLIYSETPEEDCLCIKCLAKKLKVDEKQLREKIVFFKKIGCTLF